MFPKTIHRIWLGSPMPEEFRRYGETWTRLNPGWELVDWTEANIPTLENQTLFDDAENLTTGSPWQFRSDLARYEILWRHGGLYVDTDFECLRPIGDLIEGRGCFGAWEEQDRWIANGLMGATPEHPFLRHLIDGLPVSVAAHRHHRPNRSTGPQYLTAMYRMRGEDLGVSVIDQAAVYPYGWRELDRKGEDFPDAFAVHHWSNKRRQRGEHPI